MPQVKKPPDPNWSGKRNLIEGQIDLNNMPCSMHFSYRKMRKMKRKESDTCKKLFTHDEAVNNETEKVKRKALEEEDTHQVSSIKNALGTDQVIMLARERSAWAKFRLMPGLREQA